MWWRLTKAIILSWFVGVLCGAVLVVVLEQNRAPPTVAADDQKASHPNEASPDQNAR